MTSVFFRRSASRPVRPSASSHTRVMIAVSAAAWAHSASRGVAIVTSPAPARKAPRAASRAAPVCASPPESDQGMAARIFMAIDTRNREVLPPESRTVGEGFGRDRRRTASPQCQYPRQRCRRNATRPGSSKWPGLRRKKVMVRVASIAAPRICPLEPSMPEGTSTARIGLLVRRVHSLRRRTAALAASVEITGKTRAK